MEARLLAQLAWVAVRDADAISDSYAWPPRPPLSEEEVAEIERLHDVADRLFARARAAGLEHDGLAAVFGDPARTSAA